jgi:hypothetical protein
MAGLIGQHVVLMITRFKLRFIILSKPLTAELLISELTHYIAMLRNSDAVSCSYYAALMFVSFRSRDLFYLLTAGVEVVYFHLITLTHTPQSVGLLWTRDRPVAETSTWRHKHSQETNIHAPSEIRTHDPSKRSVADLRRRLRGHWDRRIDVRQMMYVG